MLVEGSKANAERKVVTKSDRGQFSISFLLKYDTKFDFFLSFVFYFILILCEIEKNRRQCFTDSRSFFKSFDQKFDCLRIHDLL